jgi:hypothetical protein
MSETVKAKSKVIRCECGTPLINGYSGSCCPNGHGGVKPMMSPGQSRINDRCLRAELLPEAKAIPILRWAPGAFGAAQEYVTSPSVFCIAKRPGLYVRVIPKTPITYAAIVKAHVKAADPNTPSRVVSLARCSSLELVIAEAVGMVVPPSPPLEQKEEGDGKPKSDGLKQTVIPVE